MKRIDTLDYLRGAMASFIMLYHFLFWSGFHFTSADFFGKIGVYGVSIFYVLSGMTLYWVYHQRIDRNFSSIASFATKRVFRIFPLLWFVIISTILFDLGKRHYDISTIVLNLTGLFGFVKPDDYIGNGVWSIGNELVFYVFFPIIILSLRVNKTSFFLLNALLFLISIYFAFFVLSPQRPLTEQWAAYVNPLNQVILFAGGMMIAHIFQPNEMVKYKYYVRALLIGVSLLFIFYPVSGSTIHIISGWNRIIFCFICFVICACVYIDDYHFPSFLHKGLSFIGETSYSIYLVHALVFGVIHGYNLKYLHLHYSVVILLSLVGTFIASYCIYRFIEKPMIGVGKRVSRKYFNT